MTVIVEIESTARSSDQKRDERRVSWYQIRSQSLHVLSIDGEGPRPVYQFSLSSKVFKNKYIYICIYIKIDR